MDSYCDCCDSSYIQNPRCCLRCHKRCCDRCQTRHSYERNDHVFKLPSIETFSNVCNFHLLRYSRYCETCQCLICDECTTGHSRHKISLIRQLLSDFQECLEKEKENVSKQLKMIRYVIDEAEQKLREFNFSKNRMQSEINSFYIGGLGSLNILEEQIINIKHEVCEALKVATFPQQLEIQARLAKLKNEKLILEEIQSFQISTLTSRWGDSSDFVRKYFHYEETMKRLVKWPAAVEQIALHDIEIYRAEPTRDEIIAVLFRIVIGESSLIPINELSNQATSDRSVTQNRESKTSRLHEDIIRNMIGNEDSLIKYLKEETILSSLEVKPLQPLSSDTSLEILCSKHLTFINDVVELFNRKLSELNRTSESLEKAREKIRLNDEEKIKWLTRREHSTPSFGLAEKESTIKKLVDENNKQQRRIKRLTDRLREYDESELEKHQECAEKLHQKTKEIEDLNSRLKDLRGSKHSDQPCYQNNFEANETKIKELLEENKKLKHTVERLTESLHESKKKEIEKNETFYHQEQTSLISKEKEIEALKQGMQTFKERYEEERREHAKTKQILQEGKQDTEELKNRLSQVAGAKLVSGNANIADLGDKFRPTKIAEIYSEIYDNDWTNAVDDLTGQRFGFEEEVVIQHLFFVLQGCLKTCTEIADCQMQELTEQLFSPLKVEHVTDILESHFTEVKQMKDARKGTSFDVSNNIYEVISCDERFGNYIRQINTVTVTINESLVRQILKLDFFKKCCQVCWLMVVQDPPMFIDVPLKEGARFNKDLYREYTKSGTKVLFSIWPALFLHENGPLLVKGVAQVYK